MRKPVFIVVFNRDHCIGISRHIDTWHKDGRVRLDGSAWIRESDVHNTWKAAQNQALDILQAEHIELHQKLVQLESEIIRIKQLEEPTL